MAKVSRKVASPAKGAASPAKRPKQATATADEGKRAKGVAGTAQDGRRADATPGVVPATTVAKAVRALLAHHRSSDEARRGGKEALVEAEAPISVQIGLFTIPARKITKPRKITLPHALYSTETGNGVCLIVKDTVKADAKKSVGMGGVKVLSVAKLRRDYKEFEAKRQLSESYDLFLADNRVLPLLPKLLGKSFFRKKKHPVPIELRRGGELQRQVQDALSCTYLHMSGQTILVKAGTTEMPAGEIEANVAATLGGIVDALKIGAIQTLYLKTPSSVALPLYKALPTADGPTASE